MFDFSVETSEMSMGTLQNHRNHLDIFSSFYQKTPFMYTITQTDTIRQQYHVLRHHYQSYSECRATPYYHWDIRQAISQSKP